MNSHSRVKPESQFDFWMSNWELISRLPVADKKDEFNETIVFNKVESILEDKVIYEQFDGSNLDGGLIGKSWSVYNTSTGQWQQTWVGNQGSYLVFTGHFENGIMELKPAKIPMVLKIRCSFSI